jgi:hypothetical protein
MVSVSKTVPMGVNWYEIPLLSITLIILLTYWLTLVPLSVGNIANSTNTDMFFDFKVTPNISTELWLNKKKNNGVMFEIIDN